MKKIIAASVNKLIEFDETAEIDRHIAHLEKMKRDFAVVSREDLGNGKFRIVIKEQYNSNDLL